MPLSREVVRTAGVGAGTDKVLHHGYERFYPAFLSGFNGSGGIIEIGYGAGESIPFWKHLFPESYLYVLDRDVELEGDGFRVIKCDQSSRRDLKQVRLLLKDADIGLIVDDGSHIPEHQLRSFNFLFPLLRPGGSYIIEDIETSYWRRSACYGHKTRYGIDSPASIVNLFALHLPHWICARRW